MTTPSKPSQKTSGASVAKDFNNVLNGTPAFEAMRFTANYARIAKAELQSCVYEELMVAVKEAGKLLPETFNPTIDEWPADAERINENMEEKLKDCDKLAGGFKKFVENARAAVMAGAKRQ
ncbi:hypothetical protein FVEN_g6421 [Fusarium venenatum]|uniref:Uncharacterized protein n=1 Tax=Fusarium venenatum TaxID=56646 RepID=A0A2L2T7U9_9HYPO|nr:uncharacterized protein FVRRES_04683 [Fusarium venenatum]KAG8355712.1 hypothetical protein FVEN_g6421 [Fusarium venenatum]KAH6991836.1 hypothetical protein EDB82DRAFT_494592 [Fusarium venenatum]CEI60247.1 unnamed protein product [Fusarium venenatum]